MNRFDSLYIVTKHKSKNNFNTILNKSKKNKHKIQEMSTSLKKMRRIRVL